MAAKAAFGAGVGLKTDVWETEMRDSCGDGGRGGDVYIMPTRHLTSLSSVPRTASAEPGGHGGGSWLNGRNGRPLVIRVPLGTVVREVTRGEPYYVPDEWEDEEARLKGLARTAMRMVVEQWKKAVYVSILVPRLLAGAGVGIDNLRAYV